MAPKLKKENKYTIYVKNIPKKFSNKYIYWDNTNCGVYKGDFNNYNDMCSCVKSLPLQCKTKIYKCSLDEWYCDDDGECIQDMEIQIE